MGKAAAQAVGVADSYARRTADSVVLTLHLPDATEVDGSGLRLTSLGKGATRRVDVAAEVAAAGTGVQVTATVPRAEVEPGRWQLRLRAADGSGYRRARARLVVRPGQPVALLVGPAPATRMAPPKPRAADPSGVRSRLRSRLRGLAARAQRVRSR